jgi:hypothetical protein
MLGLKLDGRQIVPLRAIPFVSGGDISPLSVALAIGDWRRFDEREYATRLTGYYLTLTGVERPMLAAEFAPTLERIGRGVHEGANFIEQIQAFPGGVFVYRDDLEQFVEEINARRRELPLDGQGLMPVELSEWPKLSGADERLIVEGFEALDAGGARAQPPLFVNDPHGRDLQLQRRANAIAAEERQRRGRLPTKRDVGKVLAKETGKTLENIERRIRKEW